jgi:hypothetical protein
MACRSRFFGASEKRAVTTESFISVAAFVASVQKTITLVFCIALCACCVSGCLSNVTPQNGSQVSGGQQGSSISLSSATTASDTPVSINAVLEDSLGHVLDGKVVTWFIDGRSIGQSQMMNGSTTLSLTGDYVDSLGLGLHQVQVDFYGDTSYKSSTATAFLTITATGASEESIANETALVTS